MTALGSIAHNVEGRRANRKRNYDYLQYTADPDDVTWSEARLLIPNDILDAVVDRVFVRSQSATAAHEVDSLSLVENVQMAILRAPDGPRSFLIAPIGRNTTLFTVAIGDGWSAMFRDVDEDVSLGDHLLMNLPPAEDNVADTGTYFFEVVLKQLRYTKK